MNRLQSDAPVIGTPASSRQYLHTVSAGAGLPLIQAAISGVIVFVLVLLAGYELRFRSPIVTAGILGLLSLALVWILRQRHWYQLADLERLTGVDLNRDGTVGKPEPEPVRSVRVQLNHVTQEGHVYAGDIFDLPATPEQLVALADGLLNGGMRFSVREWCGSGRPFSVTEFNLLRNEMLRRGLIRQVSEKDSRVGIELTDAGRQVMQDFLN